MAITHPLQFTAGLFGNLISFMVFLAPLPTFYHIYKKKSTEGFHSIPYVTALFSSTLWMYYAFLKPDEFLLITINSFGCVIETIYLSMFIAYAPKKTKISTVKLLLLFNLGTFSLVLLFTSLLTKGENRIHVLGWICVAFSACVFAAPLSVMRMVIRTKSVEFMPFWLSFFLTLSAISWFSYGFLLKDIYIAMPNVLGFIFGVLQMILYFVYKNNKETIDVTKKMQENVDNINSTTTVIYEEDKEEHVIDIQMNSVPLDNHGSEMVETQKVVELTRAERTTLELNPSPIAHEAV